MDGAIRRPDAPNHFMILKPAQKRILIRLPDGSVLADTCHAVRLMEAGKTLYDPVIYLPREDVSAPFEKQSKTTHCPLKGDASYFSFDVGGEQLVDLAWSYEKPFDFAKDIEGLMAFFGDRIVIEEHPI